MINSSNHRTWPTTTTPSGALWRDGGVTQITDHSLAPLEFNLTPAERDLAAHMQAQMRFRLVAENARNHARAMYEQAEREYHAHNPKVEGQG